MSPFDRPSAPHAHPSTTSPLGTRACHSAWHSRVHDDGQRRNLCAPKGLLLSEALLTLRGPPASLTQAPCKVGSCEA